MEEEEMEDKITEDPDDQVDDGGMSPDEAGFIKGAEDASTDKEKKEDDDELV